MSGVTTNLHEEEFCVDKLDSRQLDILISNFIKEKSITKEKNIFFTEAKKIKSINVYPLMIIASNWREITKVFMFTTLIGIGRFAEKISTYHSPNRDLLKILQTSVSVISDDVNNIFSIFDKQAPKGPDGIHYLWWENEILNPLKEASGEQPINSQSLLLSATKNLTDAMVELSKDTLGFAVQLRVVEAIALDIVLAFRPLFSAVESNGKKIFLARNDLNWIYSHITAEVMHHRQVTDEESGMTIIAQTTEDKRKMIKLAHRYIALWSNVFDEFAKIILNATEFAPQNVHQ